MSSPYGPNNPQRPEYPGPQQPYPGNYGPQPGGQGPGWGPAPQQGQPQQGQPQQGQQGQSQQGYPAQQPYGPPTQQQYAPAPQPQYGPPAQPQYGPPGGSGQYGAPTGPSPYGQQQQSYNQPGQFGQPPAPRKSRKPLIAILSGIVAVIIIAVLVTAFVAPGFAKKKVLNASSVQDGVQKILTDTYKVPNVTKVSCPSGQEVKNGGTFTCTATIDGKNTDVKVTITDDNGTYQVGRP